MYKKQIKSKTISKENQVIFYFYEKYFKIRENKNMDKVHYWKLHRVYETKNFFYLYFDKVYAVIVDKSSFTQGTPEDFSKFLKKKLIFSYKYIVEK